MFFKQKDLLPNATSLQLPTLTARFFRAASVRPSTTSKKSNCATEGCIPRRPYTPSTPSAGMVRLNLTKRSVSCVNLECQNVCGGIVCSVCSPTWYIATGNWGAGDVTPAILTIYEQWRKYMQFKPLVTIQKMVNVAGLKPKVKIITISISKRCVKLYG